MLLRFVEVSLAAHHTSSRSGNARYSVLLKLVVVSEFALCFMGSRFRVSLIAKSMNHASGGFRVSCDSALS